MSVKKTQISAVKTVRTLLAPTPAHVVKATPSAAMVAPAMVCHHTMIHKSRNVCGGGEGRGGSAPIFEFLNGFTYK